MHPHKRQFQRFIRVRCRHPIGDLDLDRMLPLRLHHHHNEWLLSNRQALLLSMHPIPLLVGFCNPVFPTENLPSYCPNENLKLTQVAA